MDNDVADSVGRVLRDAGHDVTLLRDQMETTTKDPVVAVACREGGLVLVTHNVRDFRRIIRQEIDVTKSQAGQLSRVELVCSQVIAADRVAQELDFITLAWRRHLENPEVGMTVTIADTYVRLDRGPDRITPDRRSAKVVRPR